MEHDRRMDGQRPRREATPPARQPVQSSRSPQTRQRKRGRNGKVFTNPWMYLLFIFGVSVVLAALCWTAANDVLALNKPYIDGGAVITVAEGDSYGSVVKQLKKNGLIESKTLFHMFSLFSGGKSKVLPGTYVLNTDMDYFALINGMGANSDSRMTISVTIPEGFKLDQIFARLEEQGVSSVEKLKDMAANHNYAFDFLKDIPLGDYHRLEGYLFPDTYEFYMGEDPRYVINKMLVNLDAQLTDDMRASIDQSGYSIHQILTMASLIERETDTTDRANISDVIHNRLKRPAGTNGKLEIDASIAYVLPEGEKVTKSHYESVDSVYNTYKYKGLPPGPIASPGMESIVAALNPSRNGYYYYVLGNDGKHIFAKTYAQHLANIDKVNAGAAG